MLIPENRYGFSSVRDRKRKKRKLLFFLLVVIIISALVLFFIRKPDSHIIRSRDTEPEQTFLDLWENEEFVPINQKSEMILENDPLNPEALVFNGFAYFQRGVVEFSVEDQIVFFDKSLLNLRKVQLLKNPPVPERVQYIIGKNYFHKGRFFMDLAVEHLERSVEMEFINPDTFKYLGLAYSELGKFDRSIEYFNKLDEDQKNDIFLLTLGQTYFKMGDIQHAELYLKNAIEKTVDQAIEQKTRFLLGKIYLDNESLNNAEEEFRQILAKNPKSADAHYYLGEIFYAQGNTVKARAEWRRSLEIDPSHYGALLRLY